MSKYFLDCETNGHGGDLISMALVREDDVYLSLVLGCSDPIPWVADNVMPNLYAGKTSHESPTVDREDVPLLIAEFLKGDPNIFIVADWPEDLSLFCKMIIMSPGHMAPIPGFAMQMIRVAAYPTPVEGAIQHNAYWDAMALKYALGY